MLLWLRQDRGRETTSVQGPQLDRLATCRAAVGIPRGLPVFYAECLRMMQSVKMKEMTG
jgi:hypothetical protein